jgi:sec-independent protein translocase protein TatA
MFEHPIGITEIILILFVAFLFFGAKRLPEIGRSLGKSISEFKKGMTEDMTAKKEDPEKKEDKTNGGTAV